MTELRTCHLCGYQFDARCGKYGCPNCLGDGMKDSDPYARQKAYKARQREKGLVQVQVEVPAQYRSEVLRIAQAMREGRWK